MAAVAYAYPAEVAAARAFGAVFTAVATAIPIIEHEIAKHLLRHSHATTSSDAPSDMDYQFETPMLTPEATMNPVNKRAATPIETPKPKRVYEEVDNKHDRDVKFTGPSYTAGWCRDFSGVQRTRLNPVTGRIIGYKGIPRKRSLSPTSKYSEFWRQQKYAKTSFHAARSPSVWDSARR